ncbi:alpha/beta-hydrolase [Dendrothele bispora CBS 962.96]|uniref:Alpha/beta-hydrolase n=1 Tax=Dendrothele bispora (strain CBS 962.96) TaxID=1314807 RepID=A0A4V4HHJ9_DENBC|nr:alpha/beta-hydrolase [Dendrothele bispora CBS 962.96]
MQTNPVTLVYKSVHDVPLRLDVYLPLPNSGLVQSRGTSAIVYFHGGGLTVGNRRSWFPEWLQKRANAAGHIFLTADYRLIPSGLTNAHDILEDIKDVFEFICSSEFESSLATQTLRGKEPTQRVRIDPTRIAVAGTSSGGTCAYLATKHAEPKPKVLLSIYAAGGDFFTPHWISPKTTVFFRGRELLDPNAYSKWIYPLSQEERSLVVADSPNTYFPADHPTPGLPSNPRSKLSALYLQLGTYLDYYTGQHEPSLGATLRVALQKHDDRDGIANDGRLLAKNTIFANFIPEKHRHLFPQLLVDSSWPPTLFYHGAQDSAVPLNETKNMCELIRKAGVSAEMIVVDGKEHSFDYAPDAEETQKENFDRIIEFLNLHLSVIHSE